MQLVMNVSVLCRTGSSGPKGKDMVKADCYSEYKIGSAKPTHLTEEVWPLMLSDSRCCADRKFLRRHEDIYTTTSLNKARD